LFFADFNKISAHIRSLTSVHPLRGGKPGFKLERRSPLDGAVNTGQKPLLFAEV
jgi:hypothetical protein